MTGTTTRYHAAVVGAFRILVVLEAITFLGGALLHLGVRIPLGFAVLVEPRIPDAVIVEGLCGLFLSVGAYAMFTRKAWAALVAAHVFAVAGVLLGIGALAVGLGPTTELNYVYHRTILVVLVAGLVLLWTPSVKEALGRGDRALQRR